MSYLPQTKWGICSNCGGKEQEVVKVKKELFCLPCNNSMKAEKQISNHKKRISARNTGFKLRNQLAESKGTEDYFMAERQALINDLDFVFSRIVRMSAADSNGICECFTCGNRKHWSLMQCGHFIKRANTIVRWDFRNARVQDKYCNETLHGNLEVFEQKLNEEYAGITEQLKEMATDTHKWSREELKQALIDLRQRLRIIETKFSNTKPQMQ